MEVSISKDELKVAVKEVLTDMGYTPTKVANGKSISFEEFCKKYGRGHGKAWIKQKIFYRYKPDFVSNIHPGKGRSFRISDGLAAEWFAKHEKEIDWDEPLERDK